MHSLGTLCITFLFRSKSKPLSVNPIISKKKKYISHKVEKVFIKHLIMKQYSKKIRLNNNYVVTERNNTSI